MRSSGQLSLLLVKVEGHELDRQITGEESWRTPGRTLSGAMFELQAFKMDYIGGRLNEACVQLERSKCL